MDDDVLAVARWCWPKAYAAGAKEAAHSKKDRAVSRASDPGWALLRAAELELIERGHAKAYGRALAEQFGMFEIGAVGPIQPPVAPMEGDYIRAKHVTVLATAALDARVRAMAAVVRSLEAK